MSYPYPPSRYHGLRGEVSAAFRPSHAEPDIDSPSGNRTHYLATHATTGGEFGLYRMDMAPRSPGPNSHFHRTISESFFVLSGELSLFNGERWVTGRAGDFLYVPVGGLHGFRNDADEPCSMLLLFTPGAPREEYFERIGEMAQRGGEDFTDFLLKHDSYFVDPDTGPAPRHSQD